MLIVSGLVNFSLLYCILFEHQSPDSLPNFFELRWVPVVPIVAEQNT